MPPGRPVEVGWTARKCSRDDAKETDNMSRTTITRAWAHTRPDGITEVRVNVDAATGTYVLKTEEDPKWAATFASKLGGRKTEYLRLVKV